MPVRKLIAPVLLCLAIAGCGTHSAKKPPVPVEGAGVADATPLLAQWEAAVLPYGIAFSSSSGTLADLLARRVTLLTTDTPLAAATLSSDGLIEVPVGAAPVAVVYNLDGVQLQLDAPTVRAIFAGTITRWDAAPIRALNPLAPHVPITVIRRADLSTDTGVLATYTGGEPTAGRTVTGEPAMADAVAATPGAVGYVSQPYAVQTKLSYAALRNAAGAFVEPTLASATAATVRAQEYVNEPDDFAPPPTTDLPASSASPAAYPAMARYYIAIHQDVCAGSSTTPKTAKLSANVLLYALGAGQMQLEELDATPLPWQVDADAFTIADGMRCDGKRL